MKIEEIQVTKFPLVIITDTHCHVKLINDVKAAHPNCELICLGDITDLFSELPAFNKFSIEYFSESKIPCVEGNHESFIKACYSDDRSTLSNVLLSSQKAPTFNIENIHLEYLKSLPRGIKLILPDGSNYLCFHNRPKDLWSFTDQEHLTDTNQFLSTYPTDDKTVGVIHGHGHKKFVKEYKDTNIKRYSIGALKYKEYALLTEQGIQFKKI